MATHSVEKHLQVGATAYDAAIRTFLPHYEEMMEVAVGLLRSHLPDRPRILDLGGGTGALSAAVLKGLPHATVHLLDIDPAMLAEARVRLASFPGRSVVAEGSFFDELPPADAVVASLSLHHVPEIERKTEVYAAVRRALSPGGMFLNLDVTIPDDKELARAAYTQWALAMGHHGIDEPTARGHLADWAKEDRYFSVASELKALAAAGFSAPECFWRRPPGTIYGARKT